MGMDSRPDATGRSAGIPKPLCAPSPGVGVATCRVWSIVVARCRVALGLVLQSTDDLIGQADPHSEAIAIWTAAPRCQDFSPSQTALAIRANGAACSSPLWSSCRTSDALPRQQGSASCTRTSSCNPPCPTKSPALAVQPVLVCASDFGWVNRPRLWWTTTDWASSLVMSPL